jgi:SAM-dependent methyltransferase
LCMPNRGWLADGGLDLRFPERSADSIYASHFLEHLYASDVISLLRACYWALKPGAGVRLVTPHLGKAIAAYVNGDKDFFSGFPDKRDSIGGRFANHMLCRDQHRLMFDFSFMEECLASAGFTEIRECLPRESRVFPSAELAVFEYETTETHASLFVEALRPEVLATKIRSKNP